MKAHRRNGIPTLMLKDGGGSVISRFFNPNPEQRKIREQQRMGLRSILLAKPTPITNIDQQSYDIITEAIRPLQSFYQQSQSGGASTGMSPTDYAKGLADSYVKLGEYISGSQLGTGLRRSNADPNPVFQVGPQYAANLRERIGAEIDRVNPVEPVSDSMYEFSVQDALLRSAQDSAATVAPESPEAEAPRQATGAPTQAEEAAETATTPAETATTPAETAATSAATPATPAGVGPADYGSGIVGVDAQTDAAAGYGTTGTKEAAPTPTTNPTVVTSIQSTISDIMGNEEAQFDEGKRLQELKETFGLGISDMEKAAPGLAFAFSLMGAQRAPGESPFNALVRAAGSAGEAATKSKLALEQRERAIDSSLASTVLGEKKAAEQYARSKEWVALWNGGFDERGVPQAEYLRMNADQIQKANEAGLQIVPLNVVSGATTAFVSRSNAALDARIALDERLQDAAKGTSTSLSIGGKDYKATSTQSADGKTFVIPDDVAGVANTLNSTISDTAETIILIGEMRSLVPSVAGLGNVGAAGVGRFASLVGASKEGELSPEQLAQLAYTKANSAWNVGSLRGLMSETDASKVSSEMSREDIGKYFGQDAADAYDDKEKLNSIISKKLPQLTGISQMPERIKGENDSAYAKRVRFKAIQNALAAQLAPILLGESGRTISDADRVRVIALLGGFADFSKAGVLTTEEEMNQSINELERIIRKYQSSSKQDAETLLIRLDEASRSPSFSKRRGSIYTPDNATAMAVGTLAQNYSKVFPKETPGQAGQPSNVTTMKSSEF